MGRGWAFFILMAVYLFLWLPSIYGKGAGFPFLCDSWWRSVGGQCAGDTVLAEHMFTEHLLGAGRTGLGPGRRAGQRELRGPGGGPSGALTAAQSPPRASCGPRLRRPSGEGRGPHRGHRSRGGRIRFLERPSQRNPPSPRSGGPKAGLSCGRAAPPGRLSSLRGPRHSLARAASLQALPVVTCPSLPVPSVLVLSRGHWPWTWGPPEPARSQPRSLITSARTLTPNEAVF